MKTERGESLGEIPEWIHHGGDILEGSEGYTEINGFSHKGGRDSNTQGIWMWSKPFIIPSTNTENGKLCVLLMDTQGIFDGVISQKITTSIIGLCTLLSSYQIYNVDKRIQEDNLQYLALFSEYSRVVHSEEANSIKHGECKIFQQLDFLVRDWQHFEDVSDIERCLNEMREEKEKQFNNHYSGDLQVSIFTNV